MIRHNSRLFPPHPGCSPLHLRLFLDDGVRNASPSEVLITPSDFLAGVREHAVRVGRTPPEAITPEILQTIVLLVVEKLLLEAGGPFSVWVRRVTKFDKALATRLRRIAHEVFEPEGLSSGTGDSADYIN